MPKLETEVRDLREALADFSERIDLPERGDRRMWDFFDPFVV